MKRHVDVDAKDDDNGDDKRGAFKG
jgi:hypothetical protein